MVGVEVGQVVSLAAAKAGVLLEQAFLQVEAELFGFLVLVAFLYGSLFWGIFPVKERVSWESHLWGAIAGAVLAWYYRNEGPQKKRFDWEDEEDEDEEWEWPEQELRQVPKKRIVIRYDYKKKEDENKDSK